MIPDLHFCLLGLDLGLVISSSLFNGANYMSNQDFHWVGLFSSEVIDESHRFGVLVKDEDDNWTLIHTYENRVDSDSHVKELRSKGINSMDVMLIQSR